MKRFLFLMAWISGSESEANSTEHTFVKCKDDLKVQFSQGNQDIFVREIAAPNSVIAEALGYEHAFKNDYTDTDSISICEEIPEELTLHLEAWEKINYLSLLQEKEKSAISDEDLPSSNVVNFSSNTND